MNIKKIVSNLVSYIPLVAQHIRSKSGHNLHYNNSQNYIKQPKINVTNVKYKYFTKFFYRIMWMSRSRKRDELKTTSLLGLVKLFYKNLKE